MREESELIQSAQKGDSKAFGELYDRYVVRIYRFILLKVSHRQDAEDLTSKVFTKAWESMGRFEARGFPFSSWLYRIASNAIIDHYRTSRQHEDVLQVSEEIIATPHGLDETLDRTQDLVRVCAALAKLHDEYRTVLVMRFIDDCSTKEMAHALGKSEGAVRVLQHRALKELKRCLETEIHDA
jgi:RNA polymerase sigma-70 factor (ECF subfamily)